MAKIYVSAQLGLSEQILLKFAGLKVETELKAESGTWVKS